MATTGSLTFDCPWCGAISPVPGNHMGEHFPCPECKKGTKLTGKNTSSRPTTAAPPDAPHLTGDRTFDCPWCGAISSVPSSHLGESFRCPECAKGTKLTSTNTRRALVTAPPPDAPHVEASSSGGARTVALVALLAIGGGAAWYFLAGPGASSDGGVKTQPVADRPSGASPVAPLASAMADGAVPAMDAGSPPPSMSEAVEPTTADTSAAADAELKKKAAETAVLLAEQALAAADKVLEDWRQAHPGALEAGDAAVALGEATAEIDRRLADKALVPDQERATPDQIRAVDAAVRAFLDASPARRAAASSVLEAMRSDHGGREVAGVTDWHELHVSGDGFRRAAAALTGSLGALAASVPAELVKTATDAAEALRAAKARLEREGGAASPTPTK